MRTFSVEKFIESRRALGISEDSIAESCKWWANQCDGMTGERMSEIGLVYDDKWMIETDETKEEEFS